MTTAEKNLENDPDEASAIMMTLFESLAKKLSMLESTVRVRRSDLIDQAPANENDINDEALLLRLGELVRPREEVDQPMNAFSRPRFLYRLVTLWYAISWCTVFGLWYVNDKEPEVWVMVEFLSTPLAESATLAELLQTLPSSKSGAAAVRHYLVYKVIFAIGTCVNYSIFIPHASYMVIYPVVHGSQAIVIGLLRLRARKRLYKKFATCRHEKGFGYLSALGRVLTAQALVIMATVASFLKEKNKRAQEGGSGDEGEKLEGNHFLVELFAATTLSMAVVQGFELTVFVRDASSLTLHRLSKFDFSQPERAAFAAVIVFLAVNVLLYMLSSALTLEQAQSFYWTSLATYWVAFCIVGYLILESEHSKEGKEQPSASTRFPGLRSQRRPGHLTTISSFDSGGGMALESETEL